MPLTEYRRKRDFRVTPEPSGMPSVRGSAHHRFVIQKHDATRLHFDLRLELGGALVSWAVPKGLPLLHGEKRLAVKVEDHPLSYFNFEGTIPKGQYGGGTVQVWDVGTFEPLSREPLKDLEGGKLHVIIKGEKLSGEWYLVRLREENQWLIIRGGNDHLPLPKKVEGVSVITGRTMRQIATGAPGANTLSQKYLHDNLPATTRSVRKSRGLLPDKAEVPKPTASMTIPASKLIEPMKAKLVSVPPEGEWEYEVKFDGFRALAFKKGTGVALLSRTSKPLMSKFPEVACAVQGLDAQEVVIDGEIVALDSAGRSSFQLLQAYEMGEVKPPLYYYVFDLLILNGKGLYRLPLEDRKSKLQSLVPSSGDVIRFSPSLGRDASVLMAMVRRHGLEGLIGKRAQSKYQPGQRSGEWIKLKFTVEQEFVIGGYTDPSGTRPHMGALLVGYYENGKLRYAGKVGTGFSSNVLSGLYQRFSRIKRLDCPFSDLPETRVGRYGQGITASVMKTCHWLKPETVAQVKFTEWTRDGRLRQPVFVGLREDKPPKKVIRENPS